MTLEQKIADLDKKFEGFAEAINKLDKSDKNATFDIDCHNSNVLCWLDFTYTLKPLIHVTDGYRRRDFTGKTLFDCIDKMHDYFITKGGKL